jgi:hypothetical protein
MSHEKEAALLQRRNFLKFIGKAGISLPLLQASSLGAGLILSRQAEAAGNSRRKVIFVYVPDGTPQGASSSFLPDNNMTLKVCSQPLESVKDECVFFKGVEVVGGGAHGLTQRVLGAFASGVGASLDLALEDTVGATTPVASLRLSVRNRRSIDQTETKDPISARASWSGSSFQDSPQAAFETLFGGTIDSSDIGTLRNNKKLNINEAALAELKTKLGSYELQRLEQHRTAIEKLRNDLASTGSSTAPLGCGNPQFNPVALSTDEVDSNFTNLFNLQVENAVLALKCDITRVATIQLGTHQSDFSVTGKSGDYHGAIHSGSYDAYANYRAYFSERVAHLIQRLRDTDDPAGGKMIDSTLVVQVTDMGDGGAHTGTDAPFMFAGGGSAVKRRSIVSVANHHQLLDTVAEYMGVYGVIAPYDRNNGLPSGILV